MDLGILRPYLVPLCRRFGAITLSGGEPLLHPKLDKIVQDLSRCNFDLTLDTFGTPTATLDYDMLELLKNLHVTVLCLGSHRVSAKDVDLLKLQMLLDVHKTLPRLNLCINIPFVQPASQMKYFDKLLAVARQTNSKVKYISHYRRDTEGKYGPEPWAARWKTILPLLRVRDFAVSDVNPREVEYIDAHGTIIELSDIACANIDRCYGNGTCLTNTDFTIQPDLSAKVCRWQDFSVPIDDMFRGDDLENSGIANLVETCSSQCPYSIPDHPLIAHGLSHYILRKHYTWPLPTGKYSVHNTVRDLVEVTPPSYFGSSGSVRRFETQFARRIGTKYSVAVNSGASALNLAYKSVGITAGSEVIIPVLTYPGAVTPLLQLGAHVRLCDVEDDTGNISLSCFEQIVSNATKAVVVTHLWGNPVDMQQVSRICNRYDVKIVEDASHAFNATLNNRAIGSWGDVSCFSLQANKAICAGEGGLVATNQKDIFDYIVAHSSLKERILDSVSDTALRNIWYTGLGVKRKIHPYAASMGLAYLEHFDSFKRSRDERLAVVWDCLADIPMLDMSPQVPCSEREYYTIKLILDKKVISYRSSIVEEMLRHGLEAKIPDFTPMHRSELLMHFDSYARYFPHRARVLGIDLPFENADIYYDRIISLPAFVTEDIDLVLYYMHTIKHIMRNIHLSMSPRTEDGQPAPQEPIHVE